MSKTMWFGLFGCLTACIASGCSAETSQTQEVTLPYRGEMKTAPHSQTDGAYTAYTLISDVAGDPVFADYGRLLFPQQPWYYNGRTLGSLQLTWYSCIDPKKTVEIANYLKKRAEAGETIFYDIYKKKKRQRIQKKTIRDCSFLKEEPVRLLPSAAPAADLPM